MLRTTTQATTTGRSDHGPGSSPGARSRRRTGRSSSRSSSHCCSIPRSSCRCTCSLRGTTVPAAASPEDWSGPCAYCPLPGRYELGEALPVDAGVVLGLGLLIAVGTGVAGLVLGGQVLESVIWQFSLPVFGDVKLVTSLFFDIGVYLVVVGLLLDVLRSLGAEVDRQGIEAGRQ